VAAAEEEETAEQRAARELPGRRADQHVLGGGVDVAEGTLQRVARINRAAAGGGEEDIDRPAFGGAKRCTTTGP